MEDIIKLIEQHGVTVVVLLWFMLRAEKRLDRMATLIESTIVAVAALAKAIDGVERELINGNTPLPLPEPEDPTPPQLPRRRAPTQRPVR